MFEIPNSNTELLGIMWEDKNMKNVELSEYELEKQRMMKSKKVKKSLGLFHLFHKDK